MILFLFTMDNELIADLKVACQEKDEEMLTVFGPLTRALHGILSNSKHSEMNR